MILKAPVKLDKRTKELVNRLEARDIAIINHIDLDEVAAHSLANKKVSAVINCDAFISGRYPNLGPKILCKSGIPIYELVEGDLFHQLKEGDLIEVNGESVFLNQQKIASLRRLNQEEIDRLLENAENNLEIELDKFIDNTLTYAYKEKGIILGKLKIPDVETPIMGKHVLVVVRGQNYREDLSTILSYIKEVRPVLIGVDGGGDALMEFGCIPDIIVGDMDSVSDQCLRKCGEIIVHAYPNGKAPGMERIKKLGLEAKVFPAPGTSEDIAMLLAYEKGADLIVAVGTHSNMIDFLEKGRKGMASTFLVRLKIGTKLVDARGVNKLYRSHVKLQHVLWLVFAALIPIITVVVISPPIQNLLKLLSIQLRILLGI